MGLQNCNCLLTEEFGVCIFLHFLFYFIFFNAGRACVVDITIRCEVSEGETCGEEGFFLSLIWESLVVMKRVCKTFVLKETFRVNALALYHKIIAVCHSLKMFSLVIVQLYSFWYSCLIWILANARFYNLHNPGSILHVLMSISYNKMFTFSSFLARNLVPSVLVNPFICRFEIMWTQLSTLFFIFYKPALLYCTSNTFPSVCA